MSYLFEGLWAIDPNAPSNVAINGTLTICDPDDPTHEPIPLTDPDGNPIGNPVTSNEKGFVPAFRADLDRVVWFTDGLSGYVTSYDGIREGIHESLEVAQLAAISAQESKTEATEARIAAERAANLVDSPADSTVAGLLTGNTESGRAALDIASKAVNRSFTIRTFPKTATLPGYTLIRLKHGTNSGPVVRHTLGGDSPTPISVSESPASYWARTQPSVMFNAGGWWGTNRRMGLEIYNGQLIQDWETDPSFKIGVEAAVFMQDGSMKIFDRSVSGAEIVDRGGWNASSWGQAVYRDGELTAMKDDPYWQNTTARQALGNTLDGDLILLSIPGKSDGSFGATTDQVIEIAGPLGIDNLIYLDGGGSVQTWVNGIPIVPSSDAGGSRNIGDVYHFVAPMASPSTRNTGWNSITLATGFTATSQTQTPAWSLGNETLSLRGAISGTFTQAGVVVGSVGYIPGAGVEYVGVAMGPGTTMGKAVISATGQLTIYAPAGGGLTYARLDQCHWRLA